MHRDSHVRGGLEGEARVWPSASMAGWGRERSWRFQRPHTQATTGSGSQTGNEPSRPRVAGTPKLWTWNFWPFSTVILLFLLARQAVGADWPDCPRDKCPNGGVMAMDASERVEFFYESVRAIKEGRLIILIGIFIGAYPMLGAMLAALGHVLRFGTFGAGIEIPIKCPTSMALFWSLGFSGLAGLFQFSLVCSGYREASTGGPLWW